MDGVHFSRQGPECVTGESSTAIVDDDDEEFQGLDTV
jgi:hypothetical protein